MAQAVEQRIELARLHVLRSQTLDDSVRETSVGLFRAVDELSLGLHGRLCLNEVLAVLLAQISSGLEVIGARRAHDEGRIQHHRGHEGAV